MNIYFISPIGKTTPDLFNTFEEPFLKAGHSIVGRVDEADMVFFDGYSGLGEYEWRILNEVYLKMLPIVWFDATDYGGMSKEEWFGFNIFKHGIGNNDKKFYEIVEGSNKIIYFMRKMDKTKHYPPNLYPIEVIQYPDHDFTPVSKDELFNRPYDICFIGNTSPTRAALLTGLMKYKCFNIDCQFITGERIPHDQWLERHRKAKLFISACGGGFTDERKQQLITIAPMLRNKSNHLVVNDYTDKEDCIEVNENPTQADVEKILSVLNDKDKLYDIYIKGIERMHTYYNAEYRSKYILSILKQEGII